MTTENSGKMMKKRGIGRNNNPAPPVRNGLEIFSGTIVHFLDLQ
jgi:hypothetical protein